MAGISSKSPFLLKNNYNTYQNQEIDFDLGLNWIQFKWRNHDYEIGRFLQIDPLSEKYLHNSTYAFSENKVIGHVELEGLEAVSLTESKNPRIRILAQENVQKQIEKINNNGSKTVELQGSFGLGVGFGVNAGPIKISVGSNGPQSQVSINAGGTIKGSFVVAGAGGKLETPLAKAEGGVTFGEVSFQDGVLVPKAYSSGADFDIGLEREKKDSNVSQKAEIGNFGMLEVGAKFGVFGIKVSIDLYNAGEAIINFAGALKEFTTEAAKEKLPLSGENKPSNNFKQGK